MCVAESRPGGTMNDAKCKRGLRVPSITLATTSVFATEGGQVRASHRYHISSAVRPFSQHRYRQRGQTEISHACLLNKACALAALHTHDTAGISCLLTPALTLGQQKGPFQRWRVQLAAVPVLSQVACGRNSPHASETADWLETH